MGPIEFLIDFVMHVDVYVGLIVQNYGLFVYLILFAVIFLETGLVVAPFLPGDSLIFVAGVFASQGKLNLLILFVVFVSAAILGDSLNYWIGKNLGEKFFAKSKFFKREYLKKTEEFYRVHGGKTIILARFLPVVRTFAPFVAGIGNMDYRRFLSFNIFGGLLWVCIFLFGGYFFGGIPIIKENLSLVIFIIILSSIVPPIFEYIRAKRNKKKSAS